MSLPNSTKRDAFEAEEVIGVRGPPERREYLVHWKGFEREDSTWEPASFLVPQQNLVDKFIEGKKDLKEEEQKTDEPSKETKEEPNKTQRKFKKSTMNRSDNPVRSAVSPLKVKTERKAAQVTRRNIEKKATEQMSSSKLPKKKKSVVKKVTSSIDLKAKSLITDSKKIDELNVAKANKVLEHFRMNDQSFLRLGWKDTSSKTVTPLVPMSVVEKSNPNLLIKYFKEHIRFFAE